MGCFGKHGTSNLKAIDRRVRLAELLLRCLICGLAGICVALIVSASEVKEIFTIRRKAKFTDMKALVFVVLVNGLAAAYSLVQVLRCVVNIIRGSVLLNKTLAWVIFSGDQIMAYLALAAVSAAIQSGIFSKFGQTELQWMKLCYLYDKYCKQSGGGVISALFASLSMAVLSAISAFSLFRLYRQDLGKSNGAW